MLTSHQFSNANMCCILLQSLLFMSTPLPLRYQQILDKMIHLIRLILFHVTVRDAMKKSEKAGKFCT